jgi:GNAT superfamily N-acetyltransferase
MVERWRREGEANTAGTRLEIYEPRIPEDFLDEYCAAYTPLINTVPFEELDHGEIFYTPEVMRDQYGLSERLGRVHHVAVTREPDGSMSGMTELLHNPYHPDRVHQELTAVDQRQRGRGLGKWLKAALLLRVREAYPELRLVITENAGSNAPMLAINERLGFKLHRPQFGYQVGLERLAQVAPVTSQ